MYRTRDTRNSCSQTDRLMDEFYGRYKLFVEVSPKKINLYARSSGLMNQHQAEFERG